MKAEIVKGNVVECVDDVKSVEIITKQGTVHLEADEDGNLVISHFGLRVALKLSPSVDKVVN